MDTSTNQPPLPPNPTETGFPILAIAVLCIMATAFLLVSYYIFLTKCCLNMQQLDPLRRFSISRAARRRHLDPLMAYSPSLPSHGLNELLIREIPTFLYNKCEFGERSLRRCVVCLCEFQEQDMLRVLPNCGHGFHLDCIDIWLQSNDNCPLCRSSISGTTRFPIDRLVAPASSPQEPQPFLEHRNHSNDNTRLDDDFVMIELSERTERRESSVFHQNRGGHSSPRKVEKKIGKMMKLKKTHHFSIMGDECIDVRDKDEQFSIQPIRRSFSMDSAADRHVYLAVQDIIIQNRARTEGEGHVNDIRNHEESSSSSSSRGRRSFFPFGHGRGSRSSVLPL